MSDVARGPGGRGRAGPAARRQTATSSSAARASRWRRTAAGVSPSRSARSLAVDRPLLEHGRADPVAGARVGRRLGPPAGSRRHPRRRFSHHHCDVIRRRPQPGGACVATSRPGPEAGAPGRAGAPTGTPAYTPRCARPCRRGRGPGQALRRPRPSSTGSTLGAAAGRGHRRARPQRRRQDHHGRVLRGAAPPGRRQRSGCSASTRDRDGALLRPRVGVMLQDGGLPTGARAGEVLRARRRAVRAPRSTPARLAARLGLERRRCGPPSGGCPAASTSGWRSPRPSSGRPEVRLPRRADRRLDPQARLAVWDLVARAARRRRRRRAHHAPHGRGRAPGRPRRRRRPGRVVAEGTPAELTAAAPTSLRFAGAAGAGPDQPRARPCPRRRRQRAAAGPLRRRGREVRSAPARWPTVTAWCAAARRPARRAGARPAHPRGRLPRAHRPGAAMTLTAARAWRPRAGRRRRRRPDAGRAGALRARACCCATASSCCSRSSCRCSLLVGLTLGVRPGPRRRPPGRRRRAGRARARRACRRPSPGRRSRTGFDRRYGVLRLLGTTPLGRAGLLAGQACSPCSPSRPCRSSSSAASALALGWRPQPVGLAARPLVALARHRRRSSRSACCSPAPCAAEAVLAVANLLWVLLRRCSAASSSRVSGAARPARRRAALGRAGRRLRAALQDGRLDLGALGGAPACGRLAAALAAVRWFRWE